MAEEPSSGTEAISNFDAAKKEVTATAASQEADLSEIREEEGPPRPKRHPNANSPAQPDGPGAIDLTQRAALARDRQLNEPYADHNASIKAQQAAQSSPGSNDWAKEILKAAAKREAEAQAKAKDDREL